MDAWVAWIPLLPLLAFGILILFGRRWSRLAPWIALMALTGSAALSIFAFLHLERTHHPLHLTWQWLRMGERTFSVGLLADPMAVTMCLVVTTVGWLIVLYSVGYMHGDLRYGRFFAYLCLFFGAMLTLVLADHLLLLYIGWEGVGLCSYLLIGFWFERPAAARAGRKAFLTTRVGDLGLFGAILFLAWTVGDLSFAGLMDQIDRLGHWKILVALLIFFGAVGKSAQIPLHVWLPDAMEGPTPVSALIHAATMVAAGVYLVARTMPLFLADPTAGWVVACVGICTSFFAATVACTQTDLKRVLAYSTISQLGLMMVGLGAGSVSSGMFHLVTHAWFKALLFLGAGSVIHALHHQEITQMGGLWRSMPITALTFLVGSLAMAGLPPFSGFWSKEEIFIAVSDHLPPFFLGLSIAISGLTAFYIGRLMVLTFWGRPRGAEAAHAHESPAVMTLPLIVMASFAVGIGWILSDQGWFPLRHFLEPNLPVATDHHGPVWLAPLSMAVAMAGLILAWVGYGLKIRLIPGSIQSFFRPIHRVVAGKYFVDELYGMVLLRPLGWISRSSFAFDARVIDGAVNGMGDLGWRLSRIKRWVDEHLIDRSVNGLAWGVERMGASLRLIQTGLVQNYLLVALAGAILLFAMLHLWLS